MTQPKRGRNELTMDGIAVSPLPGLGAACVV